VKRICIGLGAALAFAVFGTATALAQPAKGEAFVDFDSSGKIDVSLVLPEEVEILRRLLDDGFNAVYGYKAPGTGVRYYPGTGVRYYPMIGPAQLTFSPDGAKLSVESAAHAAPPVEGLYLKDYGVVYTVTLPPPPNNMLAEPAVGVVTRTPLSPWERTRKELRGEKIEEDGKPVNGAGLSDVILKVMADNGKHFTRLTEGERITVAVTFRDDAANGIYHPQLAPGRPSMPGMAPSGGSTGGPPQGLAPATGSLPPLYWREIDLAGAAGSPQSGGASAASGSAPGGSSPADAPEDFAAWLTDVRNAVRLGELHLKRGKSQDAIAAYKEALARLEKEVFSRRSATAATGVGAATGDVPLLLMAVELCNKMAQVYVQTGDAESGRAMIQRASKLAKQAEQLTGAAAEANPRPETPALPSKLVVTASKKLLDEVGSGKTSFEAFRKMATVEYVKPSADKR
jgi:Tetratricopeptide repeat